MKSTLDRIEARLQAAIENHLPWLRNKQRPEHLTRQLIDSFRHNLRTAPTGEWIAPDDFVISLHPDRYASWQGQPDLIDQLVDALQSAAEEVSVRFTGQPSIRLVSDAGIRSEEIRIDATFRQGNLSDTASIPIDLHLDPAERVPQNAYLVVHGSQMFPLTQPVINLGRRSDCHLIVDDPRVSRSHAQIRAIQGSFVLFDLNSTGGTFVNNQRITQWTLQPGDVISLAGVPLIYSEDIHTDPNPPEGSTSQLST